MSTQDEDCIRPCNEDEDRTNAECQSVHDEKVSKIEEPKLGMLFKTLDDAYYFYNEYARRFGFSTRKSKAHKTKSGITRDKIFCCSAQGFREEDRRRLNVRHRDNTRTGCKAHMLVVLQENGQYCITRFEKEHNHEIVTPSMSHMLRSHKRMAMAQTAQANLANKSEVASKPIMESMANQVGVDDLGFPRYNYLHTKREKDMEIGGAGAILKFFEKLQMENSSSFHSIQLDAADRITNAFWADSRMVVDYHYFGDVVCFDTSFRINQDERPFASFVGVNHHRQIVIFGAALLYDETIESFKWVFESFLNAMGGKMPKTILTDQCEVMEKAIEHVFPKVNHRLCVWHIYQNAAKHLSHVFCVSKTFEKDFSKVIYGCEEEDEFLTAWEEMLCKYDLKENTWLKGLFEVKEKWALVYGRNHFSANMESTQRNESMSGSLRGYLKSSSDLSFFFTNFEEAIKDRRKKELEMDFKMIQSKPHLNTPVPMLQHAAEIYTPTLFREFEKEYLSSLQCLIKSKIEIEAVINYKVSMYGNHHEHVVTFSSPTLVLCTCKKFEFVGLLCAHGLRVLFDNQVMQLPSQYFLKRWSRDAKNGSAIDYHGCAIKLDPNRGYTMRASELVRISRDISNRAAENEKAYLYALNGFQKIRSGVEKIIKEEVSNSAETALSNNLGDASDVCPRHASQLGSCHMVDNLQGEGDNEEEENVAVASDNATNVVKGLARKDKSDKIVVGGDRTKQPFEKRKRSKNNSQPEPQIPATTTMEVQPSSQPVVELTGVHANMAHSLDLNRFASIYQQHIMNTNTPQLRMTGLLHASIASGTVDGNSQMNQGSVMNPPQYFFGINHNQDCQPTSQDR
ncbi:PREDICTED: protein FAR1-RELATED SEQUENCE 5-like [Nelumbo nucifera]|uniref:Protein FAR1-RELATED SEQUENCE n=1 Tax=Nelumbo nucifera TaxID=4432 RepID=A0A1U7ZDZ9_NELNU|nr:PREDICTED: protein FAR1-RELATED SEQUENCE 5-like [Nelumbo nucifera]